MDPCHIFYVEFCCVQSQCEDSCQIGDKTFLVAGFSGNDFQTFQRLFQQLSRKIETLMSQQWVAILDSRAISPWPIGPQTLGPRTLGHRHPKSQGPKGRGPNIPRTSGPRPSGPSDLRCQGLMVRGPKVQGPMGQGLFIVLHRFFIISCG